MRPLLLLVCLAACDSPAPRFIGAERTELQRGAFTYVVYRRDNRAEAIRLGYAPMAERAAIAAGMPGIIAEATGCRVIESSVRGDSGEMRARLNCPD
jgi:hypothetical protein